MSENLGKASVLVNLISDVLPNVTKEIERYQFDVNALAWASMQKPDPFYPFMCEFVTDTNNSFSAIMPTKRKRYVDNYMWSERLEKLNNSDELIKAQSANGGSGSLILWKPTSIQEGVIYDMVADLPDYVLYQHGNYVNAPKGWIGPEWVDAVIPAIPFKGDMRSFNSEMVSKFIEAAHNRPIPPNKNPSDPPNPDTDKAASEAIIEPELHVINQRTVRDGLWWEVESNAFLTKNMPFWVTIRRMSAPASSEHETVIVLQMGLGDKEHAYDLIISDQKKPQVIEYVGGRGVEGVEGGVIDKILGEVPIIKTATFEEESSRLFENEDYIQIGIMTIAGRLIFFVNDSTFIYTSNIVVQEDPTTTSSENVSKAPTESDQREIQISAGAIRVFGTNIQATVDACPMTFAEVCAMPLDFIPKIPPRPNEKGQSDSSKTGLDYRGVNEKFETKAGVTVAQLPQEEGTANKALFGVDCSSFSDANGVVAPKGFGFHRNGWATFRLASEVGLRVSAEEDFYLLIMASEDVGDLITTKNNGAPFFFKIKGGLNIDKKLPEPAFVDISSDVLDVSETASSEEYYMVKKNVNVTLYNKGGKYDYLKFTQKGIDLSWGWFPDNDEHESDEFTKTFTGIVVSATTSEVPGEEKITLNCLDYMHILESTPILNSPIYDGMIMYYAAEDIVKRAGIIQVINDWSVAGGSEAEEYFLPSGFAFSQPAVHFEQNQVLYECLKFMLVRPEAFAYFDENGIFHVNKLPGGLFSSETTENIVMEFYRDLNLCGLPAQLIVDEKAIEYDRKSTVNRITAVSVDMKTRATIVKTKSALAKEDNLMFRKVLLYKQAALGRLDVVTSYLEDLAARVFYPIKKGGFKTVGDTSSIQPFSFITVDGDEYRVLSYTRTFSAGSNDFVNEYNVEWLGGK